MGHKVHAVTQWRDNADPGDTMKSGERAARNALAHVAEWHPIERAVPAVDVARHAIEYGTKRCVFAYLLARRHRYLQIAHPLTMLGKPGEQPVKGFEAVGKTFRVVQSVDADHQMTSCQTVRQPSVVFSSCRTFRLVPEGEAIYPNRRNEGLHRTSRYADHAI